MAEPDPTVPQSNDSELQADFVRALSIVGPLGRFNVLDVIIPTFNMGQVSPQTIEVLEPAFRTTDIFTQGIITAAAAGTLIADTGPLAAGTYDMLIQGSQYSDTAGQRMVMEFRNAGNTANLATWEFFTGVFTSGGGTNATFTFGLEFALNERLRMLQGAINVAGQHALGTIFARRRT